MKNNLIVLVKSSLYNSYNLNKFFNNKEASKKVKNTVLTVLIFSMIIFYMCTYSYSGIKFLSEYNLEMYIPLLFFVATSLLIFTSTLYRSKNILFDVKDNDILFSMPIKHSTILLSRVITLLIMNLIYSIIVFLPSIIIFAICKQVSLLYYITSIIATVLLPIIPTILACVFGYFIAFLTSKVKATKIIELFITFIVFFGVMIATSSMNKIAIKFVERASSFEPIIKRYLYPIHLLKGSMFSNSVISLVMFIAFNVLIVLIFVFVLNKSYVKIISQLKEKKSNKKRKSKYESNSVTVALIKKEFRKYISTPVYVFNTFIGLIIMIISVIYVLFSGTNKINEMLINGGLNNSIYTVMLTVSIFIVLMSNTACSSISLEGKNLWILKSLPVTSKQILKSKVLFNMLVVLPIAIICILIIGILFKIAFIRLLLLIVLICILSVCVAQFGLIMNLKYPKLDYSTEAQAVKQSMSTFVSTFPPMMISFVIAGILFSIQNDTYINYAAIILLATFAVIAIIEKMILNSWGEKRFENII